MKKILLLNGSPKGKNSCTLRLTNAFLKGLNRNKEYEIEEIHCGSLQIKDCTGCFYCWRNEEGTCAIKDDMQELFKKYLSADLVIWSFPNYFYGMPATVKRVMDRLLPIYYQNLASDDGGSTYHLRRHELKDQKYLLFCSCGLSNTVKNTEGIEAQFRMLYGESCDMLFCSQSQLLSGNFMDYCTRPYLQALEEEGASFGQSFRFSREIKEVFSKPFLPLQEFLSFVDASSVLKKAEMSEEDFALAKLRAFFQNMTFTYDPTKLTAERSVLEIRLTDSPYTCQLHMDKSKCVLVDEPSDFLPYRLRIVSELSFFSATKGKTAGPDLNVLIQLINKFEKMGISKEMKFH